LDKREEICWTREQKSFEDKRKNDFRDESRNHLGMRADIIWRMRVKTIWAEITWR
jgi:hypothetical protein